MALRLRRGTNSQRLVFTPEQGELLYVTDTEELYIGNGTSVGGIRITGNADASLPSLTQDLSLNSYRITGTGSIEITGAVNITGNVTATQFVGSGALLTNLPSTVVTDASYRINLVNGNNDKIVDSANSTFTGTFVGDGAGLTDINFTAINGSSLALNILGSDDSIILDSSEKTFKGSVIAADDVVLVDHVNKSLNTAKITIKDNIVSPSVNGVEVQLTSTHESNVLDILGQIGQDTLSIRKHNGSASIPLNTNAGQLLNIISVNGYYNDEYKFAGGVAVFWEDTADLTVIRPKSKIVLGTNTGFEDDSNVAVLDSTGVFSAPSIRPGVYANIADRDVAFASPLAGQMVFVVDIAKFQGFDGAAWVNLN